MAVVDQRSLVRFRDVNANIINTNDSYHILLLLSLIIGEKDFNILLQSAQECVCARKVGWRSRPFPSQFFSFFHFHLSVHSFFSYPDLLRL